MATEAAQTSEAREEGTQPSLDNLGYIETPEQLAAYQKASNITLLSKEEEEEGHENEEGSEDDPLKERKKVASNGKPAGKKAATLDPSDPNFVPPTDIDEGEEEEEQDEEFSNVVEYLDKEFELGLNLKALPKGMTREQEAEHVASILRKANDGFQARIAEYEDLNALLQDKEVADFLKAKSEGKTLKDIAVAYATAPEGAPDDVLVTRHLKTMFPTLTDAEIAENVKESKDKGRLEKMAGAAREFFKADKAKQEAAAQAAQQQEAAAAEREYQDSVAQFGQYLTETNQVYGVKLTPDMKKKVFVAVTRRDNQGLTYHDRVLQSNGGTLLSALGVLLLKDVIKNASSTSRNKVKREVESTLFDTPGKTQSGSETRPDVGELDPNLVNQF